MATSLPRLLAWLARRPRRVMPAVVPLVVLLADASARGEDAAEGARRARVALRVGQRAVTVGELEDQLAEIHPLQLQGFGSDRVAVVRGFADGVVVRNLVLAEGAEQRGLAKALPTSHQLTRARASAALRAVRKTIPASSALPAEDVAAYYQTNRSHFETPERIHLSRILVASERDAERVLGEAKHDLSISRWNDLAREHSVDKATNLRGGNLGFVAADGTSNEAGVRVEPALFAAAKKVKDGELVPTAVAEGAHFAVVWRRGTVPENKRTVEEADAQIRTTIYRQRTEAAEKSLIDALRARHVKDVDYGILGLVELGTLDAGLSAPRAVPSARPAP